ncbi:MAG: hypothetical protein LBI53_08205 [Candidatus Peribacteria bacterium]|jgi:hypothetical protein|nr:hypothetical protein [Candidatus Peribacteria bacterium]
MKDSNKTIATTTQLISENNIKEMIRKIEKGLQIQDFRYLPTTLTLNNTTLNVNIQEVATIQKNNISPIKRRQVNNEIMISEIIKKQKPGNYAFFIPNNEGYTLTGNSVYADEQKVGDLNSADFSFVLSMSVGELQAREIRSNQTNMQYGYAIFSLPTLEITKENISLLNDKYLIASTFSKGSTKNLDAIGIFDPDNFLELNRVYPSIQDSHERDESIGFRGDFKNMTLFAQGERVGEASMKF